MAKLTALKVKRLNDPGRYGDGDGLWLQVRGPEAKSWLFRYNFGGRARQMGLGPEGQVGLAEARELAREAGRLVRAGLDPIADRRRRRVDAAASTMTFRKVAQAYITAHETGWKNAKHAWQWGATLEAHVYPVIGDEAVGSVTVADVMKVLEPIWHTKTETASRVRGRIESVLDFAKSREWRSGENTARWRGHLQNLLPKRSKVAQVQHHPAMPWAEVPAFLQRLRALGGVAARALEFTILTAARSGEARGATWGEIGGTLWTVPPERMKAGKEHRVPLSPPALAVVEALRPPHRVDDAAFVFPGGKQSAGLSNMAMMAVLRRMKLGHLTVHGFRSSFRDWCAEATGHPRELAEAALAHVLTNKVEASYQRGDMLTKRAKLMADWAAFCNGKAAGAEVW